MPYSLTEWMQCKPRSNTFQMILRVALWALPDWIRVINLYGNVNSVKQTWELQTTQFISVV